VVIANMMGHRGVANKRNIVMKIVSADTRVISWSCILEVDRDETYEQKVTPTVIGFLRANTLQA
jgi:hypothetical protein